MKKIKICYTDAQNLGDAINPLIVSRVLGYEPELSNVWNCEMTGIGSGLRRFFISEKDCSKKALLKRKVMNAINKKTVIIWSAGFLSTPNKGMVPLRNHFKVASVRGTLSKQWIEEITQKPLKGCTVGDAGILASELIPQNTEKKYKLGIIPHRSEKTLSSVEELKNKVRDSIVIDIEPDNPLECLTQIAGCECILSSSLHGLIFADSFRIPNKHIILSDNLSGDGFKFNDYYSAFSLMDDPIDMRNIKDVNISDITSSYCISDEQVTKLKEDCKNAFYMYL